MWLSPSDVTAYLACEHLTALSLQVARGEIPAHTALAAADLQRAASGRRDQLEERVPVAPIHVVPGRPGPGEPVLGDVLEVPAHSTAASTSGRSTGTKQ